MQKSYLPLVSCISQFQLRLSPPGNCEAFARLVSLGGGALTIARGPGVEHMQRSGQPPSF